MREASPLKHFHEIEKKWLSQMHSRDLFFKTYILTKKKIRKREWWVNTFDIVFTLTSMASHHGRGQYAK